MSNISGQIWSALIASIATVLVCIINNNTQMKKDREARDQKYLEDLQKIKKENETQINESRKEYTKQISDLRADFMAHLEELIATNQDLVNQIEIVKLNFDNMKLSVEKHNHVIERTYELEKRMDVAEERQKTANHRIEDLEKKV